MKTTLELACALGLSFVASPALAQTPPPLPDFEFQERSFPRESQYVTREVPAPSAAAELTIGTGYTQGFGMLREGVAMPSVATSGLQVAVGGAYRLSGPVSLGLTAGYQQLSPERTLSVRGLTAAADVTYHFAPQHGGDPWVQLGAGYRMLWETPGFPAPTLLTHGFQLARLTAGYDFRFRENVALAPVVGADMNLFLWQDGTNATAIASPRVNTFVFVGAQGRFDFRAR